MRMGGRGIEGKGPDMGETGRCLPACGGAAAAALVESGRGRDIEGDRE
jgi:hypothetical protein